MVMMEWLWPLFFLQVSSCWAAVDKEIYSDLNGGIMRQSPPIVYRGGLIQYPKPGANLSNIYRDYITIYTQEGWKTTFTVEKSDLNIQDHVKFIENHNTQIYNMSTKSRGEVFETRASVLLVDVILIGGSVEADIRVRWISTHEEDSAIWGFLNFATFDKRIRWSPPEVETILINLVSQGNTSWTAQLGDTSVDLEEGEQILSTSNLTGDSTLQLVNNSSIERDFVLEWFPYTTGNEGQYMSYGFLSYPYTEPRDVVHSWQLKDGNTSFPGSSLKISFYNVTTYADSYTLKLLVGMEEYLIARHSIVSDSVYYIPVVSMTSVSLTITTTGPFTLLLCYGPSDLINFKAVGYMKSNGYPDVIRSDHPTKVEGMPLPANWSLTTTVERLELAEYRAWLDLSLTNKGIEYNTLIQSYTGASTTKYVPTQTKELRYPLTQKLWLNYFKDFGLVEGRYSHNEIVGRFQSSREATYSRKSYGGYSLRVEAELQTGEEGFNIVYYVGDSGTIESSHPYYSGTAKTFYDVTVSNTSAYNAIEFTFGDSYTEPEKDVLEFFNHESRGKLRLAEGFTTSGNMTGMIFSYKSTRMTIKFVSNECTEYKGFTIHWRAVNLSNLSAAPLNNTNVTRSSSTSAAINQESVKDVPPMRDHTMIIAVFAALGVVILLLLVLLGVTLAIIIKDRRKLCDLQRRGPGFYRPKYIHTDTGRREKLSD
ncbi:uncharacterized protein [Watersipora subatra]|uniref:uncharacterized protein n=1 Tax=Watersipora subatra TaxID=2589382 RepID=UPI00355B62A5